MLSKRYREVRQKEFISKPCHKQLKDGTYSNNVQNCGNSDLFGSNFTHEQNDQDIVYKSRTDNESNMTYNFPAQYMTQSTTLTNYCLCTCCHKTDIPRSQCIMYHLQRIKVQLWQCCFQEALLNQFSIPTLKE